MNNVCMLRGVAVLLAIAGCSPGDVVQPAAAVPLASVVAGARPPFVFPSGCCFYQGRVVRTVVPPARTPQEGRDNFYGFASGAAGQKGVVGVAPGARRTYKLWQEGKAPSLVVEVTSESSRQQDLEKKEIYARLGVLEYFLFDPLDEYLHPRLQGFRWVRGTYRPIPPDRDGSLLSKVTGLRFQAEGERLRLAFVPGLISAAASFHFPARRPQGHHEETPFGIRMPGDRFVAEKSC